MNYFLASGRIIQLVGKYDQIFDEKNHVNIMLQIPNCHISS